MESKFMASNPSHALARAAQRAISNEFFLAGILHEYQETNRLDDSALAAMLECDIHDLPRLALCRRPDAHESFFLNDIKHLEQRFHLRADRLATIVRQVDSLRAFKQHLPSPQDTPMMLQAARDRDEDAHDTTEDTDD
jgi:hypothetical protein